MRYMKRIVALCLVAIFAYTMTAVTVQVVTGQELSPTLTEKFLTVIGTELCAVAFIKISEQLFKKKKKRRKEETDVTETEIP